MRCLAAILVLAGAAAAPAQTLTTSDGKSVEGALVSITAQKVVVKSGGNEKSYATTDVRHFAYAGRKAAELASTKGIQAVVANGASVGVREITLADGIVAGKSDAVRFEKVAAEQVVRILRTRPAETPLDIEKQRKIAKIERGAKDAVLVNAVGTNDWVPLEGIIDSITAEKVTISYEGNLTEFEAANVPLIEFAEIGARAPAPAYVGSVQLTDGSTIAFTELQASENRWVVKHPGLGEFQVAPAAVAQVVFASGTNDVYLTDMPVAQHKFTPFFDERGTTEQGRVARLGERTYDKALVLRPKTEITYTLGGTYNRFRVVAGTQAANGKATLTLLADSKALGKHPLTATPTTIETNLGAAKSLTLVVDFVEDTFGSGATVILADPVLTK